MAPTFLPPRAIALAPDKNSQLSHTEIHTATQEEAEEKKRKLNRNVSITRQSGVGREDDGNRICRNEDRYLLWKAQQIIKGTQRGVETVTP